MKFRNKLLIILITFIFGILSTSCSVVNSEKEVKDSYIKSKDYSNKEIKLMVTNSIEDKQFLEDIVEEFELENKVDVNIISKRADEAMLSAQNKLSDIVLIDDKEKEEQFIKEGCGENRYEIMYNYFVLVGPTANDENLKLKEMNVEEAFKYIKENNLTFLSRGDKSGIHSKELSVWENINERNNFDGYNEVNKSMKATLKMASEMNAYTLTDIEISVWENINERNNFDGYNEVNKSMKATLKMASEMNAYTLTDIEIFNENKDDLDLEIINKKDECLKNTYSLISISNLDEQTKDITEKLIKYYISDDTQNKINDYVNQNSNEQLFYTYK